jgi:hypothetical protein
VPTFAVRKENVLREVIKYVFFGQFRVNLKLILLVIKYENVLTSVGSAPNAPRKSSFMP